MNKRIVMLDAGHGGVIGGHYVTPGKRSPDWAKGVLYEGAFNRWVAGLIVRELDYARVPYYLLNPEPEDVTLSERVARANALHGHHPGAYGLSIHANAGGGTGMEGFTSIGQTASDAIAEEFLRDLEQRFAPEGWRMRFDYTDGDRDKEANFTILRRTRPPFVLLEAGFMDSPRDYDLLWDRNFQQAFADTVAGTIIRLYDGE